MHNSERIQEMMIFVILNLKEVIVSFHLPCTHRQVPTCFVHCNIPQGMLGFYDKLSEEL